MFTCKIHLRLQLALQVVISCIPKQGMLGVSRVSALDDDILISKVVQIIHIVDGGEKKVRVFHRSSNFGTGSCLDCFRTLLDEINRVWPNRREFRELNCSSKISVQFVQCKPIFFIGIPRGRLARILPEVGKCQLTCSQRTNLCLL